MEEILNAKEWNFSGIRKIELDDSQYCKELIEAVKSVHELENALNEFAIFNTAGEGVIIPINS